MIREIHESWKYNNNSYAKYLIIDSRGRGQAKGIAGILQSGSRSLKIVPCESCISWFHLRDLICMALRLRMQLWKFVVASIMASWFWRVSPRCRRVRW